MRQTAAGSTRKQDEVYDLRGLDLRDPDMVMPTRESPKADNCRMYARESGDSRVAIRTRKGSRRLSTPVGETINVTNTQPSTGDAEFDETTWITLPFTPSADGALTKLEFEIKQTATGYGHVLVQIYTDDSGYPGTLVSQGAILDNTITTSYQYLAAYFIDGYEVSNGTQYWALAKVQDGGTATYAINKTAASGGLSTTDLVSYNVLGYTWRYKTYLSTVGNIIGFTRRYPSNNQNRTLFAMGTDLYEVTDAGVVTSIDSTIDAVAEKVRFAQADDKTIFVDGLSSAKWYDGTSVSVMGGVQGTPSLVAIYENRAFFVPSGDPTRVNFSDLYSFESYSSTNFFYVPEPKSVDDITGLLPFQNRLVIFTHETKHLISGSSLGSFTRQRLDGTKGAVSDEAIVADKSYIYFMADDKLIYRFNGVSDELISEKVEPELRSITDVASVRFHLYNNQLRVYYKVGSEDRMLLLEVSEESSNKSLQWFRDTGRPVLGSLEWVHDDNELIEFSSKYGAIFYGETDDSDLGKPISFKYWTRYDNYGSGMSKDRVKRFRPFVRPTNAPYILRVGKDIDFEDDATYVNLSVVPGGAIWGDFVWGDGTTWGGQTKLLDDKIAVSGRGKYTQFRFECDMVETTVEIYGFGLIIKSGKPR